MNWEQIASKVESLYTREADDEERMPYAVRAALGDTLTVEVFEGVDNPAARSALLKTFTEQLKNDSDVKTLWNTWIKLKKHTQNTLFETLQNSAIKERAFLTPVESKVEETPPKCLTLEEIVSELKVMRGKVILEKRPDPLSAGKNAVERFLNSLKVE
jgi:hypothetical protein